MVRPICRCPNGHVFESRTINIEGSTIAVAGCSEPCPAPGCSSRGTTVSASYSVFGDFIHVSLLATARPSDEAAVSALLSALAQRVTPPSRATLDSEFPDVPAEVRDWLLQLLRSTDWSTIRRFIAYLLPLLIAWKMSADTDKKIDIVDDRIRQVQEKTDALYRGWLEQEEVLVPITRPHPEETQCPSPRATPKGTPPRLPEKKRRKRRKRR